jgi:hypothetical protein
MEIHTPILLFGKEQIDAVQSKGCNGRERLKNQVFILKLRKKQLEWINGRTCTYTVKAR